MAASLTSDTAPQRRRRAARRSGRWVAFQLAALALALSCAGDADSAEPVNMSFDDHWCNDRPCGWDLDMGRVEQVSTWHSKDYAVRFLGPGDAQISQRTDAPAEPCLNFDIVAKVDRDATLMLRLDFNEDGNVDWTQSVSNLPWRNVPFSIPTPTVYRGVRYVVLKQGAGDAVVAQVVVHPSDDCPGFPLLLEGGSLCEDDSVCTSGSCLNEHCQPDEAVRQPTESE